MIFCDLERKRIILSNKVEAFQLRIPYRANVVPVVKKGEKGNIENYRPISLTCISAKVMERMYDELFCRTHHLIDSRQKGFLKNNSCAMSMTNLIESVSTNLLHYLPTDIIYFDFAKAFDSVNHDLILSKLKYQYNIDGHQMLLQYYRECLKAQFWDLYYLLNLSMTYSVILMKIHASVFTLMTQNYGVK